MIELKNERFRTLRSSSGLHKTVSQSNKIIQKTKNFSDLFRLCPPPAPSLVGAYYLQTPDTRAIILHNDLLCNDTCSVTGGSITYWGGGAQTEKIHFFM